MIASINRTCYLYAFTALSCGNFSLLLQYAVAPLAVTHCAPVPCSRCTPRRVTRTLELSRTQLRRPARRVVTRSGNKVSGAPLIVVQLSPPCNTMLNILETLTFQLSTFLHQLLVLTLADLVKIGSSVVESAAELVPSSVPRPLAKVGVAVFGVSIVFWLLQKVGSRLQASVRHPLTCQLRCCARRALCSSLHDSRTLLLLLHVAFPAPSDAAASRLHSGARKLRYTINVLHA